MKDHAKMSSERLKRCCVWCVKMADVYNGAMYVHERHARSEPLVDCKRNVVDAKRQ